MSTCQVVICIRTLVVCFLGEKVYFHSFYQSKSMTHTFVYNDHDSKGIWIFSQSFVTFTMHVPICTSSHLLPLILYHIILTTIFWASYTAGLTFIRSVTTLLLFWKSNFSIKKKKAINSIFSAFYLVKYTNQHGMRWRNHPNKRWIGENQKKTRAGKT